MSDQIWHEGWGRGRPVWTERSLCDDGGKLLTDAHRELFRQAVYEAQGSKDGHGFVDEGDVHVVVNMHGGFDHNTPRYAIRVGLEWIAGGMVSEELGRRERIYIHHMPEEVIYHGTPSDSSLYAETTHVGFFRARS